MSEIGKRNNNCELLNCSQIGKQLKLHNVMRTVQTILNALYTNSTSNNFIHSPLVFSIFQFKNFILKVRYFFPILEYSWRLSKKEEKTRKETLIVICWQIERFRLRILIIEQFENKHFRGKLLFKTMFWRGKLFRWD